MADVKDVKYILSADLASRRSWNFVNATCSWYMMGGRAESRVAMSNPETP